MLDDETLSGVVELLDDEPDSGEVDMLVLEELTDELLELDDDELGDEDELDVELELELLVLDEELLEVELVELDEELLEVELDEDELVLSGLHTWLRTNSVSPPPLVVAVAPRSVSGPWVQTYACLPSGCETKSVTVPWFWNWADTVTNSVLEPWKTKCQL